MGIAGTLTTVIFTYHIFTWIVGEGTFGVWPFIAAIVSSLQNMWHLNRLAIMNKIKFSETLNSEYVLDYARAQAGLLGNIGGLMLGGYLFMRS